MKKKKKGVGDGQGSLACCLVSTGLQTVGHDRATELNHYKHYPLQTMITHMLLLHMYTSSPPQYYRLNMYREHIKHKAQCWASDIVVHKNRHSPVLMEVMG